MRTYPLSPSYGYGSTPTRGSNTMGFLSSFAAPVLGGIFSARGARRQNQMARELAQKQMDFQERMSSTAYQRSAKDLEAAGLNRILALGKPASSPGGAMAPVVDEIGKGVGTALALRRQNQELRNMKAVEFNTKADTRAKTAATWLADQQALKVVQETLNLGTGRKGMELDNQIKNLRIPGVRAEADLYNWLASAKSDEVAKAAGKAGPLVLQIIKMFMLKR